MRTIDLFAGAGGLSLGFELAGRGFYPEYAVESDEAAARTFKENFGCPVSDEDIRKPHVYPNADIVIGGPPCQGFSPLGRDRDDESRAELNQLWEEFFGVVKTVGPQAFVIENVPQFRSSEQFDRLLRRMRLSSIMRDYQFEHGILNAADYGVPQARRRFFFVAVKGTTPLAWPPPPTNGSETEVPHKTVRDAIGDLPPEPTDSDMHWKRNPWPISLERYRAIPPGGNRFDLAENRPDLLPPCWRKKKTGTTDVMGRLWWDRPSCTIRTEFYKPEKGRYLHPVEHRAITFREAARLQSFPDDFRFVGSKPQIAKQIGNAVPPLLGSAIANYLADLLDAEGQAS